MLHRLRHLIKNDQTSAPVDAPATGSADPTLELNYLFIVTYGRSGSTLLMSILDTLPGFCIRGENGGVLYDLFTFHTKATNAREKWSGRKPLEPLHPWYGIDGYPEQV